jgi:hypothetical protein
MILVRTSGAVSTVMPCAAVADLPDVDPILVPQSATSRLWRRELTEERETIAKKIGKTIAAHRHILLPGGPKPQAGSVKNMAIRGRTLRRGQAFRRSRAAPLKTPTLKSRVW